MYKVKDVIMFILAYIWSIVIKKKNIWIITERRAECKDNGYYLFKYIRENFPDKEVYYAIEKESAHIAKIEKYGHILYFNSLKHYAYALAATKLIGAFLPVGIPDSICFYKFPQLVKGQKIFLQHGITIGNVKSLYYENTRASLFICGGKPESEFVEKEFGYLEGAVKYTGFCRYDGLINIEYEKVILLMPTWRKWIPSATWGGVQEINIEQYEYFQTYKSLIQNEKIRELLQKYDYKMIFFLHHEMQPYMKDFNQLSKNIVLATEEEYDVQYLLKTSACLITDYSSVAFDFAYMKKPVIYYQFDEEEYYSKHYPKGYFEYERDGFGNKCKNINEVIEALETSLSKNNQMEKKYKERVEKFFLYHDTKNCERVYKVIKSKK